MVQDSLSGVGPPFLLYRHSLWILHDIVYFNSLGLQPVARGACSLHIQPEKNMLWQAAKAHSEKWPLALRLVPHMARQAAVHGSFVSWHYNQVVLLQIVLTRGSRWGLTACITPVVYILTHIHGCPYQHIDFDVHVTNWQ